MNGVTAFRRHTGSCNLCGWPVIRWSNHVFGNRCIRCLSTQIHRALGFVVDSLGLSTDSSVYELSSRGALFLFLKKRFRNFYYSDYFDDVPPGGNKNGVLCQDVQNLSFPKDTFDLVTSTEVFEHVPDDMKAFSEIRRVLRPGGWLVFTVPLAENDTTVERAFPMPGGGVNHLLTPEYHSDRIRGTGKVLAYRNYGRDITDRLRSAGIVSEIRTITSERSMVATRSVVLGGKKTV